MCCKDDEQVHQDLQGHTPGPNNDGGHNLTHEGMLSSNAGTSGINSHTTTATPPTAPLYRILLPALLPGARCYTDASTAPDHSHMVFLQALMTSTTSVLMAEAAALDLAASMVSLLSRPAT